MERTRMRPRGTAAHQEAGALALGVERSVCW